MIFFGEYAGTPVMGVVSRTYELREQLIRRNKIMTITRGIAAAATFAAVAVGAASPAWATQTMSGHYIATETAAGGQSSTTDWYFTPCGDGCANVTIGTGTGTSQARLVNNQWALDIAHTTVCPDGSEAPSSGTAHITWDPNTLAGSAQITEKIATCGAAAPDSWTNNFQLTQAPTSPSQHAPENN